MWLLYKSRVFKNQNKKTTHMPPVCFVSELKHLGVCVCIDAGCRAMPKPTGRTLAGLDEGNMVQFVLPQGSTCAQHLL